MRATAFTTSLAVAAAILSPLVTSTPTPQAAANYDLTISPSTTTNTTTPNPSLALPDYRPTCYPVKVVPSDFDCHDAVQQFANGLRMGESYTITRVPRPGSVNTIAVPKKWTSGSCVFTLNLKNRFVSISETAAFFVDYANALVNTCVADQANTGGGETNLLFPQRRFVPDQTLHFEVNLPPRPKPWPPGSGGGDGTGGGITEVGNGTITTL